MGSEEETGSPSFAEESDTIYLRMESVIKQISKLPVSFYSDPFHSFPQDSLFKSHLIL